MVVLRHTFNAINYFATVGYVVSCVHITPDCMPFARFFCSLYDKWSKCTKSPLWLCKNVYFTTIWKPVCACCQRRLCCQYHCVSVSFSCLVVFCQSCWWRNITLITHLNTLLMCYKVHHFPLCTFWQIKVKQEVQRKRNGFTFNLPWFSARPLRQNQHCNWARQCSTQAILLPFSANSV